MHGGGAAVNFLEYRCFDDVDGGDDVSREEAEAESWLLPNPGGGDTKGVESVDLNTGQYVFGVEMHPYLDMDRYVDPKVEVQEQNSSGTTDGVVPVQSNKLGFQAPALVDDNCCFDLDFSTGSKTFSGGYGYDSLSHSVSSLNWKFSV